MALTKNYLSLCSMPGIQTIFSEDSMLQFFTDILIILGFIASPVDHTEQELTVIINSNRPPIEQYIEETNTDTEIIREWDWTAI